jgi:hypothetical protein
MCRVLEFSERTFYAAKVRPMSAHHGVVAPPTTQP